MKILDREAFMKMPSGTIYAKYEPCFFGELTVKSDTLTREDGTNSDWVCQGLVTPWFTENNDSGDWACQLERIEQGDPSPPIDFDFAGRDGCFEQNQLFAVWETRDVAALIQRLQAAYDESTSAPTLALTEQSPSDG